MRNIVFNNDIHAQEAEGERIRLAQENESLRAQIRRMKIAAKNPVRSRKDEKLTYSLTQKVCDYEDDLQKTEAELAKSRTKFARNAEEHESFVRQLKERYDRGFMGWKKELNSLEGKMTKQAKSFKAKREHCYALMVQLEEDL